MRARSPDILIGMAVQSIITLRLESFVASHLLIWRSRRRNVFSICGVLLGGPHFGSSTFSVSSHMCPPAFPHITPASTHLLSSSPPPRVKRSREEAYADGLERMDAHLNPEQRAAAALARSIAVGAGEDGQTAA